MFTTPGILLKEGNQRAFTKIIEALREKPTRKSTATNLDRIRCCIEETFGYRPTDSAIWTSIRSNNIHRLSRNFLWKCVHNIFHVGSYWDHVPNLEMLGQCQTYGVLESLEHIILECDRLTEIFWKLRYRKWPKLNWGLILGWKPTPAQSRLFTMIVLTSMSLIWSLRNKRIHNRWVSLTNAAQNRDRLLSNRARFGSLATKKQLVLNTWSGTLLDGDSLTDDWTIVKGVLVGIRPTTRKNGVG
ncbi:hypothetical protein B0H19DRAFT_1211046 [Mycena capillaripes]|nr:hypothetical protein B0H19DRAFT_1211046 [Mycena capillaripes]